MTEKRWIKKEKFEKGDVIRVERDGLHKYGIYISPVRVLAYIPLNETTRQGGMVHEWHPEDFFHDGYVAVREYSKDEKNDLFKADEIEQWAQLFFWNGGTYYSKFRDEEHFTACCTLRSVHARLISGEPYEETKQPIAADEPKQEAPQAEEVKPVQDVPVGEERHTFGKTISLVFSAVNGTIRRIGETMQIRRDKTAALREEKHQRKLELIKEEQQKEEAIIHLQTKQQRESYEQELLLMEARKVAEAAIQKTKEQGLDAVRKALREFVAEADQVVMQRFAHVETSSMEVVKSMNAYYQDLEKQIILDSDEYHMKRVPQLFHMLQSFDDSSPMYGAYVKIIDAQIAAEITFKTEQLRHFRIQHDKLVDSAIAGKAMIAEMIMKSEAGRMEHIQTAAGTRVEEIESQLRGVTYDNVIAWPAAKEAAAFSEARVNETKPENKKKRRPIYKK